MKHLYDIGRGKAVPIIACARNGIAKNVSCYYAFCFCDQVVMICMKAERRGYCVMSDQKFNKTYRYYKD